MRRPPRKTCMLSKQKKFSAKIAPEFAIENKITSKRLLIRIRGDA